MIEDYAATEEHLRGPWTDAFLGRIRAHGIQITPALTEIVAGSPPEALDAALARVEREHGSVLACLRAHGLSDAERDRLADALLD